ncbi:DUF3679 domain-containing protein [Brevibacillus laterosporus]|uniref:DUF3679 domain-containing protein n=1 Tax=Brevibacillus laterosporus LMG 15441 TaxID=1042163 RepID=A0A075R2T9_BRELA|nr:DUF3679 domain-containing protein [Brevibacillus laterosporus]AIG25711.1 hypothetical protein BRLA_c013720 [Brevibacillus laterosporus LMG 15441]RJL08888.1 DUF3679 domain-containing protein [Brevibacillus laterosporus]TPH13055.1 DUF3679 domain-containing protein [Brevibacillus laterosporus]HAS00594.1 DUF3679 domain-containing protein [Brevibacillus sp.]
MVHTIRFIGMVILLLIGIVLGMQTAEQGINKVDGSLREQSQTFAITKVDNNQVEIAVMGKQVRTEPKRVVNYVGEAGESVGRWIKKGTEATVNWISGFFEP